MQALEDPALEGTAGSAPVLGRLPKPSRWKEAGDSIGDWGSPRNDRIALAVIGATLFYVLVLHPARVFSPLLFPFVGALTYFGMVVYQRHWWVLRTASARGASVVRSNPSEHVLSAVFCAALALSFALYPAFGAVGVPLPDLVVVGKHSSSVIHASDSPKSLIFVAVFAVFAVAALLYGRFYKARESVVLTPEGVTVRNFPRSAGVRWDQIAHVAAAGDSAIVLTVPDGPSVVIDAADYAPKGSALFWMLRNYRNSPQHRHELGNGIAMRRLMQDDFPHE